MSLTYSRLPPEACRRMGVNSGVLLTAFDVAGGEMKPENILGATEGAVRFAARPRLVDLGQGVANCPEGARELLCVTGWEIQLSGTLVTADAASTRRLIGLCDAARYAAAAQRLTPRGLVDLAADFGELWLVFDYGDLAAERPGHYALRLKDALSTGGLQVVAEDGRRARWPFELTACPSLDRPDDAGFEVYVRTGEGD